MLVSDIIKLLPASLEWMVLFNRNSLEALFDDHTIKHMFFIPLSQQLTNFSHVVLTSAGLVLAPAQEGALLNPLDHAVWPAPLPENSLSERFKNDLSQFNLDAADCLGVGELEGFFPPAVLYLKITSGIGKGQALFSKEPIQANYELLQAVGVEYLHGDWVNDQYLARFTVDLSSHISAGRLSEFSKTGYCNAFFLRHGSIGPTLAKGLIDAAQNKIETARLRSGESVTKLAVRAKKQAMPMQCQPPPPKKPFPFGDVVPLGFLLRALRTASMDPKSINRLEKRIQDKKQHDLWPFHGGDIPTTTDSALILLGINDPKALEALEAFADGNGGYYPQLWGQEAQPGTMQVGDWNRHWCQTDFATTCLIRAFRRDAGLPTRTTIDYLEAGFEHRGGLFLANPYLVDWTLALAIHDDPAAGQLSSKLLRQVLESMNEDYSFGRYDIPLSTAFAILCLAALGHRTRSMLLSQYRLSEYVRSEGSQPLPIPFYSTFKLPDFPCLESGQGDQTDLPDEQIIQVGSQYHALSFYLDQYRMIETAVIHMALSETCSDAQTELDQTTKNDSVAHPRYHSRSHAHYLSTHVLPGYIINSPTMDVLVRK